MSQDGEKELIRKLGLAMGWGHIMQLAEECWREHLAAEGFAGGEHTHGPCAALLVPCVCADGPGPGNCDWCCGTARVTKRVKEAALGAVMVERERAKVGDCRELLLNTHKFLLDFEKYHRHGLVDDEARKHLYHRIAKIAAFLEVKP